MKWYAVPSELPPGARKEDPTLPPAAKRPAIVVNEHGEQIAEFEELQDAEKTVSLHNGSSSAALDRRVYGVL
ncbi:hypothetical protein [Spiribacter onubensis]|uniref:Uncharacterized protein n=1 Tax=Spiribacter onubensis TaxID=3122420 RepID=A0ABV3S6T1_9GAMM